MPRSLAPAIAVPALLLAAGYAATVVAPATARDNTHRTAATRAYTKGATHGRALYANNGCVACHTLARQDAFTDAALGGAPSGPAEGLNDVPGLLGDARYGPDLSCVGDRVPGAAKDADDAARLAAMEDYLRRPSAVHHGSTMPSYRILKSTDLRRIAMFLVEHTCGSAS